MPYTIEVYNYLDNQSYSESYPTENEKILGLRNWLERKDIY